MSHHMLQDMLSYDRGNHNMMLVGLVLLFLVILFIFLLHILATRCLFNNMNDRPSINNHQLRDNEARGECLHPYVIGSSIPVFVYHDDQQDNKSSSTWECAICLCDIKDGEMCRRLPSCGHEFHVECIDIWLSSSHFTCPICRTLLLPQNHSSKPIRKLDQNISIVIAASLNRSGTQDEQHNSND